MKKLFLMAAVATTAFVLSGCGGGGDERLTTNQVATSDMLTPINAANGQTITNAVSGTNFNFPNGVPDFGTAAETDVILARGATLGTTTQPNTFAVGVTSAGQTASGNLTFASCIFTVTASTFPAGSPLANGRVITITGCNLRANTNGEPADNVARTRLIFLQLNAVISLGSPAQVSVNSAGSVTINGTANVGTVSVSGITGA